MAKRKSLDTSELTLLDVTDTTLEEWLSLVDNPPEGKFFVQNMFPTEGHRAAFLRSLCEHKESVIKMVLRNFLISTGSTKHDTDSAAWLVADLRGGGTWKPPLTEHNLRRLKHHFSKGGYPVWEGIGWVLDLLPSSPRRALDVLDAFSSVHCQHMTDNYLSGHFDAMAIIRQRYIVDPKEGPTAEATIKSLDWRGLELLCGALFEHMGYTVTVTPPSGDDGLDVLAIREELGKRERVVVQVKQYGPKTYIEKDNLVHLVGLVDDQRATRGVLVTTGPVRKGAWGKREKDQRIDIIDLPRLVQLLSEHCGTDWPDRVDRLISTMNRESAAPSGS